ncbi:helix-turn-helix domain-containing protein [Microbacterium sp. RG1]|uniref:helix-turn-helix domain-containing protein n=1 Tax=Microbacterium sp. RG1 TaxID=2489212 RepID=UPI001376459E|nr:helix-turn-helix domain-containing protein [Microbacterium sp. RG1]
MTFHPGDVIDVDDDLDHAILTWRFRRRSAAPEVDLRTVRDITVSRLRGGACVGWRDRSVIDGEKQKYIGIGCNLGGSELCYVDGNETITHAGDIMMWRSDAELAFEVHDELSKLTILVPIERFSARFTIDTMPAAWHLSGASPMGAIAAQFFSGIAQNFLALRPAAVEIALDGAIGMISRSISLDLHAADDPREALYARVLADLDRRIRHDLVPADIAQRHGVSLRHLQALFAGHGQTISGWVRERRLQGACDEVTDAACTSSFTDIAQRWRFSDGAHFSRLFTERFGVNPRTARERGAVPTQRHPLAS